jgi:lysophospholipase L1-like esterase
MLPKPNDEPNKKIFKLRKEVIRKTYFNAISNEDKNVYYIDYSTLYKGFLGKSHTIDGCHPNDLGFYLMAKEIKPILSKILKEVQKHDK